MSRALVSRIAVTLFLCCCATHAQARDLIVTGIGGTALPLGGFADARRSHARAGWLAGGSAEWGVAPNWSVGLDGSVSQHRHGEEGRSEDLGGGAVYQLEEDRFKAWQVGAHGKRWIPIGTGAIHPYALLGLGVYSMHEEYVETITSLGTVSRTAVKGEGDPRLGGRLGIGSSWMLTPAFGFSAEATYNLVSMDEARAGFSTLQYVNLNGGLRFSVPVPK